MKNKIFFLLILILGFIPIVSLFHPGLPWTHDGADHVVRIANFYQNLTEGNLVPRWAANLNWGYGHPILEFLYPLPSYIASFFHFLGLSLVDSAKVVFGMGMVLSTLFMYLWLSQFVSRYPSLFGAVLYSFAPYRFVETYVRGDIGENLAFAFIPLVLFCIYKIYKKNDYRFVILGVISLAFLILSHNAISLMFMPFILVYSLYLAFLSKFNKRFLLNTFLVIFMGLALSSFFWIPALLEGKYTLRNIVTKGGYLINFVNFKNLIYSPWSYGISGQFSVQFGLFQWLALLFSPYAILSFRKNKEKYYLVLILLLFSFFAVFLMLSQSNFVWSRILLLQNFQFPWRFLAIIVFSTAVLGALLLEALPKRFSAKVTLVSILIIILLSTFYWSPKGYLHKSTDFYTGVYRGTTDTGESAPIWSIRFMEQFPKAHLEVIDGNAAIKEIQRISTSHKYEVKVNKRTLFEENTLYFPGWEIKANGTLQNIEFQNKDYRGVMTFFLNKGNYTIDVNYRETRLRLISDIISMLSFSSILIFLLLKFVKARVY